MSHSHPVIVMILVLFSFNSYAGESVGKLYGSKWLSIEHEGGLVSLLPTITPHELLRQVQTLRSTKIARLFELKKTLEANQFGVTDALITVIMPGGLAYAAYRNMEHKQVESQFMNITTEVNQLNRDLKMLKLAADQKGLPIVQHFYPVPFNERSYTLPERQTEKSCEPWCASKLVASASPGVQVLETDHTGSL